MRSMAGCVGLWEGRMDGGRGAWVVGVGQAGGHALGAGRAWDEDGSMRSMAGCVGGLGKGRSMRSGKGGWAGGGVRGWWG